MFTRAYTSEVKWCTGVQSDACSRFFWLPGDRRQPLRLTPPCQLPPWATSPYASATGSDPVDPPFPPPSWCAGAESGVAGQPLIRADGTTVPKPNLPSHACSTNCTDLVHPDSRRLAPKTRSLQALTSAVWAPTHHHTPHSQRSSTIGSAPAPAVRCRRSDAVW